MTGQPLYKSAAVTLDAVGSGEVDFTPPGGYDWWTRTISVEIQGTDLSTPSATATLELDDGFLEGTYSGNRDTSDTAHTIPADSTLVCRWSGGVPGAQAVIRIRGTQVPAGTERKT